MSRSAPCNSAINAECVALKTDGLPTATIGWYLADDGRRTLTSDAMGNTLTCTSCGLDKTESVVYGGSYILRCASCGNAVVATSFLAMLDSEQEWAAFVDSGPGKVPRPEALVARGPLHQISAAVNVATSDGNLIRLIPVTRD